MLQRIREKTGGKIALAILAVLAVSFVFFGVNMSFTSAGYLAKVDGTPISIFEVQQVYQNLSNQFRQQLGQLPIELDRQLQQNAVDQVITGTALKTYFDREGYRVDDETVQESIREVPVFQDDDGKFSYQLYRDFLAARGLVPTRFESDQRDNLRLSQVRDGIASTAFTTPAELRRHIELQNESRVYRGVVFDRADYESEEEVSDDDVQAYYDANPEQFQTEDSASISYVELTRDTVASGVEISDENLSEYFESVASMFEEPAERNPRHILIPVDDDEEAAEALAAKLLADLEGGADFLELAQEYSKDAGSAAQGGDLGWVREGQFVGPVDDAVWSMSEGELRGPIESEFGLHIVRLDGIRSKRVPELADVRDRVERQYRDDQASQRFLGVSNALADALFDNPDLEALAESQGLEIGTFDTFTRDDAVMFDGNPEVIDAVFGENAVRDTALSDLIEIADDRQLVLRVDQFRPAAMRPVADVRDDIRRIIRDERASRALEDAVAEFVDSARAEGSIAAAAKNIGANVAEAVTVRRNSDDVAASLRDAVFAMPKPESGRAALGRAFDEDGNVVVFQLDEVLPGRVTELSVADRDNRRRRLAEQAGLSDFGAFVASVREQADVKLGTAQVFDNPDDF